MENKVEEPALQYNFYSLQEYWEIEESTEDKNEYYNGNLVVMHGASLNHNHIVMNLAGNLSSKVKSNGCKNVRKRPKVKYFFGQCLCLS